MPLLCAFVNGESHVLGTRVFSFFREGGGGVCTVGADFNTGRCQGYTYLIPPE
jgi:hypothetical protein